MGEVINYEEGNATAICPFMNKPCKTECMLMKRNGWGEPACAFYVIADELANINSKLRNVISDGRIV